jgi:hypothetical protein
VQKQVPVALLVKRGCTGTLNELSKVSRFIRLSFGDASEKKQA